MSCTSFKEWDPLYPLFAITPEPPPLTPLTPLQARKAEATILVTKVKDPSSYGVVVMDEQGLIQR
jgi:hypothetical protein